MLGVEMKCLLLYKINKMNDEKIEEKTKTIVNRLDNTYRTKRNAQK